MTLSVHIDPNLLAPFEAEGHPQKRTLRLDLGVGDFEIEIRKVDEEFHTLPPDPERPATREETAQIIHFLSEKLRA